MSPTDAADELIVADAPAWRGWLDAHESDSDGVWLVLAKKGTTDPTRLTYAEALDEALCSGWIDGPKGSRDAVTFRQRFTPRRARSMWSARNVAHIARLTAEGRLRARGDAEVDRAKADGRWDRAYAGSATAEPPAELLRELDMIPGGRATFDALTRAERYSILHPLMTAPSPQTFDARLRRALERLAPKPG
ncbi:YdeI/OmpD-associated family protein [Microbacterium kribbense]|uniref:YdeI/OmpD-associated family protein n=1 Tax=Microbacterium kribbense TaxID=433645 RepID=A0ABP7GGW3_9MICO